VDYLRERSGKAVVTGSLIILSKIFCLTPLIPLSKQFITIISLIFCLERGNKSLLISLYEREKQEKERMGDELRDKPKMKRGRFGWEKIKNETLRGWIPAFAGMTTYIFVFNTSCWAWKS
jgi:hypothetical protein